MKKKSSQQDAPRATKNFSSLSGPLYIPQKNSALLTALHKRVKGPLAQAIEAAYTTVAQADYQREADAMLAKIAEPGPIYVTQQRYSSTGPLRR